MAKLPGFGVWRLEHSAQAARNPDRFPDTEFLCRRGETRKAVSWPRWLRDRFPDKAIV